MAVEEPLQLAGDDEQWAAQQFRDDWNPFEVAAWNSSGIKADFFEPADIAAIAKLAHSVGALLVVDSTWSGLTPELVRVLCPDFVGDADLDAPGVVAQPRHPMVDDLEPR